MASSPAYGGLPPLQGSRRSFIVPHRQLSHHEKAGLVKADAAAELLYSHSQARIISFSVSEDAVKSKSKVVPSNTDYPIDTVETLPWRSKTETLCATGQMIIEKVQGSTYFLKSGNVTHAILHNSQCWCVDGVSKFVLRIRKFFYYRIELPIQTPEETEKVEELKKTLQSILRFERTPCPFIRAFRVELPEDAITPRRTGQWKPREGSLTATPDSESPSLRRTKNLRTWSMRSPVTPGSSHDISPGRESDYGFLSPERSSPSSARSPSGTRSRTPSSLGSHEDLDGRKSSDQSSESGLSDREIKADDSEPTTNMESVEECLPGRQVVSDPEPMPEVEAMTVQDGENEPPQQQTIPATEVVGNSNPHDNEPAPEDKSPKAVEDDLMADSNNREELAGSTEMPEAMPEPLLEEMPEDTLKSIDNQADHQIDHHVDSTPHENSSSEQDNVLKPGVEVDPIPEPDFDQQNEDDGVAVPIEHEVSEKEEDEVQRVLDTDATEESEPLNDAASVVSSVDSFHTIDSADQTPSIDEPAISEDFDKTPMAERLDPMSMKSQLHKREISELTVTSSAEGLKRTPEAQEGYEVTEGDAADRPSTPMLDRSSASDSSWSDVQTPSSTLIRDGLRRRLKSRRSYSPLPSSANVFSPSAQNQNSQLASAVLQKACSIALVKPIEVVLLVVHVLARIAGGATVNDLMSGDLFRTPRRARRPSNFPESTGSQLNDVDEEDDFAVPLRGRTTSKDADIKSNDTDVDSIYGLD